MIEGPELRPGEAPEPRWFRPKQPKPEDVLFRVPFSEERVASFDGLLLPVHKLIYVQERIDVVDVTLHDLAVALEQAGEEDAAIYFNAIDEYVDASRNTGGAATIGFVAEHCLLLDEPEF